MADALSAERRDLCQGSRQLDLSVDRQAISKRSAERLYRAVDRDGKTLDFLLSEHRDTPAALWFFKFVVGTSDIPNRIAIDESGANLAGLKSLNVILKLTGAGRIIGIVQSKYLNNIVEQDHRLFKRITRPMLGFKAFHSAAATLAGIKTAHMIGNDPIGQTGVLPFKRFVVLAA